MALNVAYRYLAPKLKPVYREMSGEDSEESNKSLVNATMELAKEKDNSQRKWNN